MPFERRPEYGGANCLIPEFTGPLWRHLGPGYGQPDIMFESRQRIDAMPPVYSLSSFAKRFTPPTQKAFGVIRNEYELNDRLAPGMYHQESKEEFQRRRDPQHSRTERLSLACFLGADS